jgi:hypothetical protein
MPFFIQIIRNVCIRRERREISQIALYIQCGCCLVQEIKTRCLTNCKESGEKGELFGGMPRGVKIYNCCSNRRKKSGKNFCFAMCVLGSRTLYFLPSIVGMPLSSIHQIPSPVFATTNCGKKSPRIEIFSRIVDN